MTSIYSALANADRVKIMAYLATGVVASNRELSNVIDKSEGWTRGNLVELANAGLIVRPTDGDGSAAPVRNRIAPGVVWPVGIRTDHCRVLAVRGRPDIMDLLLRDGPSTVGHVADVIDIRQPSVTKHLQAMVGVGLVKRDHKDRNSYLHSIADGVTWPVKWRDSV